MLTEYLSMCSLLLNVGFKKCFLITKILILLFICLFKKKNAEQCEHSFVTLCFSFWYHLHDPVNIASEFSLSLIGGTSSVELWSIKKGQTNGWENACLLIGNRPQGWKVMHCMHSHLGHCNCKSFTDFTFFYCPYFVLMLSYSISKTKTARIFCGSYIHWRSGYHAG